MLHRILPFLVLLGLQASADPLRYGFVPIRFTGDYKPVEVGDFMKRFSDEVALKTPNIKIVPVDAPEVAHWNAMMPPDPSQVKALIQRLGVDRLAWGTLQLRTESKIMRIGGGNSVADTFVGQTQATYNYIITVAGAADICVADGVSGKVLLDEPFAIFESETTAAPEGSTRFDSVEKSLALHCSSDLADRMVLRAQRELKL